MKDKSSIEVDLDDPRAARIAEVLSSKTAKRILNLIAQKGEMSGSDIAEELNMPLNTVTYNLKKLSEAGLIEKARAFFWSSKGKRMEIYKVSNKKIIITPRSAPQAVLAGLLGVLAVAIIVLVILGQNTGEIVISDDELKQFNSLEELKEFLEENSESGGYGGIAKAESFASGAVPSAASDSAGGVARSEEASDYSTTNIQVEGVDEPDIVKNDGKYIYAVAGNKVVIVDAFPAEEMKMVSEIEFKENSQNIRNIFVNEDKLIVFVESYEYIESGIPCLERYSIGLRCGGYSKQETKVHIYDVSNRKNPELENEIELEGNYVDARMIDEHVYLVSQKWIDLNWFDLPVYSVNGLEKPIAVQKINYIDAPDENYVYNFVSAIDIDNGEINSNVYLTGSSGVIYVSEKNIYLSYQKRIDYRNYEEKKIRWVADKTMPNSIASEINDILDDEEIENKEEKIERIMTDYYGSLEAEDLLELTNKIEEAMREFELEMAKETEKTIVHKIGIDGMDVEYESKGEVPGIVLNQFSFDEYKNNLRIATTTGNVWDESGLNHLYVLDEELEIIGSVEDLAKGERIYSARFIGDKAYMVTFKKVDPLFVIDLSDAENPKVLGYLKITGYSDYLHPYDENHIIGIGKETAGGDEQFSWYQGIKVSLFDVSDFENPTEVAKIEIGDRGTDSAALYEHKAFLFDKEKGIIVIPITLAEIDEGKYCEAEVVSSVVDYDMYVYFGDKLRNEAIEIGGPTIEGFTPKMYLDIFEGLVNEDFDEVRVFDGVYRIENGVLVSDVQFSSSASGTVGRGGERDLLDNLAKRFGISVVDKESVDEIINLLISGEEVNGGCRIPDNAYGEQNWVGAYVLNINENEISVRGKITHSSESERICNRYGNQEYCYFNIDYASQITRSLFMDDFLYTISGKKIKSSDLKTIEDISELRLPSVEDYPYPVYAEGGGVSTVAFATTLAIAVRKLW